MENKRKTVQFLTAVLYNLNIKGLFTGKIFRGWSKSICVPGLNCYSCPAAVSSCPLGALQSTISTIRRGINLSVIGILLAFSVAFGRFVCGWMCPFGLLQELLYKIPGRKMIIKGTRLRWLKYVILAVFVLVIPLITAIDRLIGIPAFCKYICPQGTIGGLMLMLADGTMTDMIGGNFIWKTIVLGILIILAIFTFRPFCRFICPLGALYGIFNHFALIRMTVDVDKCIGCGACKQACPVQLDPKTQVNNCECIRCCKCVKECSEDAICITGIHNNQK